MKALLIVFVLIIQCADAQNLYKYEKEISNKNAYLFKDIEVENSNDSNSIFGTLITPKYNFEKLIVIVPGTGYNSKNNHYQLTEELLQNGIGVFRFDERKSINELKDLSSDLLCVVKYLADTSTQNIGLLGHSLGGLATLEVFTQIKDEISFLIQWAAPVEKHAAFIKYQVKNGLTNYNDILIANTIDERIELIDIIHSEIEANPFKNIDELYRLISKRAKTKGFKKKQFKFYVSQPNNINIIKKNFESVYKNIKIPLLYVIGSNDKFIDPVSTINILKSYNNPNIKTIVNDGLNHYLNGKELSQVGPSDIYNIDNAAVEKMIVWLNSFSQKTN